MVRKTPGSGLHDGSRTLFSSSEAKYNLLRSRKNHNSKRLSAHSNPSHYNSTDFHGWDRCGFFMSLEPRHMFDGAMAADLAEHVNAGDSDSMLPRQLLGDPNESDNNDEVPDHNVYAYNEKTEASSKVYAESDEKRSLRTEIESKLAVSINDEAKQLIFVDKSVQDYQQLLDQLVWSIITKNGETKNYYGVLEDNNIEVHFIEEYENGIDQITRSLEKYNKQVKAVHILSHGDEGVLYLGDRQLNKETINGLYAEQLKEINESLVDGADLLIYGCNFGSGERGEEVAKLLSQLIGVDVAASNDITGHISLGGDWDLEVSVGDIESAIITADSWIGALAPANLSVSGDPTVFSGAPDGLGEYAIWEDAGDVDGTAISLKGEIVEVNGSAEVIEWLTNSGGDEARIHIINDGSIKIKWQILDRDKLTNEGIEVPLIGDVTIGLMDIDGRNGNTNSIEGVGLSLTDNVVGYTLSPNTTLRVADTSNGQLRIDGTENNSNSDITNDDAKVLFEYAESSEFVIEYFYHNGGSTNRFYLLDGTIDNVITNPVTVSFPEVDLDQDDSSGATGLDYTTEYVVGDSATSIGDIDIVISDPVPLDVQSATITLTNTQVGDQLNAGTLPSGITATATTLGDGSIRVTLNGTASQSDYELALNQIKFQNNDLGTSVETRVLDVQIFNEDGTPSLVSNCFLKIIMPLDVEASNDSRSVDENSSIDIDVLNNDNISDTLIVSGDAIYYLTTMQGTNGLAAINPDNTIKYTPTANYFGTDTFDYSINSLLLGLRYELYETLPVGLGVDNVPRIGGDYSGIVENFDVSDLASSTFGGSDGYSIYYEAEILISDTDNYEFEIQTDDVAKLFIDGVEVVFADGRVTQATETGAISLDAGLHDIQIVYYEATAVESLAIGYKGSDTNNSLVGLLNNNSVGYNIQIAEATVDITIDSTNVAPDAVDDDFSLNENSNLSTTVATNDSDADGDSLTFSLDTDVSNGSLTFDSDGGFVYVPTANFNGTDSFTYIITDPEGATDTATVNITINSTNVSPDAVDDDFSVDENGNLSTTVATNDGDADGDSLTFTLDTDVSNGSLIFNDDGSFVYVPTANFNGTDSFTYIITDPEGAIDTATVLLTINSTNVAPVALNDDFSVDENEFISDTVATNDSDADGDSLTFSLDTDVSNGTLIFDSDGSFVYVPTDNFNGTDSFSYIISDPEGATDTATVNITIDSTNVAPVAVDDDFSVDENGNLSTTVATNDSDADGDSLTFSLDTDVNHGSLTFNSNGSFVYVPTADFNGTDSFTYIITDPEGETDTATVNITIDSTNVAPVAVDDDFSVDENGNLSTTVATNDSDVDGDSLNFSLDTDVSNGSLTFNSDGSFVYVPTANFNGTDSFTYIITDPEGATDSATVNITIDSTNITPDAVDDDFSVDENSNLSTTVATNDSDADGDSLIFSLDTDVSNGSLTFNSDGSFVYVPTTNFNGTDSFTYTITDPEGATDTATVNITIDSTNIAPNAVDDDFSVDENDFLSTTVATNDSDADGDSLTFSLDADVSNGTLVFNSDGSFVYVPTTNFNGTDSFTYIITDPEGASDMATVLLTINSTNVAPVAVNDDFSVDENDSISDTVATNDSDDDGDSLTFTLDTDVSNGSLTFNSNGSFVYVPTANFNGSDSFTYIITDPEGASDTATVSITIDSTNISPDAVDDDFSVDENSNLSNTVATNDSDADGDSLTFSLDTDVSNGSLTFNGDGSFVYVPTANFNGTDSFTYIITDPEGATDTATVNISVDSTNVAPDAQDDDFSVDENSNLSTTVATNDSDADGDSLTFSLDTDVSNGSLTFNGDGSFVYVPTANFNGTDSFTYIITDPEGATDTATVNISVDSTNVAPDAQDDDFSVDENSNLSTTVATNDSDADGDNLTFSLDTDVSNGSLTFNSNGSFVYVPTTNFNGADSFTYIIIDPEGATDTATVNITIDSTNVAPVAVNDDFSVDENSNLSTTVATNDSDADGDSLTFSLDTDVSNGSLTFNSNGSFVYVPTTNFNGADSFTYVITDPEGASDTATVNITIDSTNVSPDAQDDDFSVSENGNLSTTVATNDSDSDGDSLTFSLDTDVSNGSLTFNSDGSFVYAPTADFNGTDSFTYIITDPEGATDTATVNITIDSTNVSPDAVDDDFSVDENDFLSDTVATNDSDADGDSLTFTLDTDVSNGTLVFDSDGSFVYIPTANFNGADSFTYIITDPEGATDTATVEISINSTNVAPDAVDDDFSVSENGNLSTTVATNDSDSDGDSLTFSLDTNVSNGSLTFNSNGSFVYVPTANFNGVDSFTYVITDPEGATDTATVNITIDSTNVSPDAADDDFSVDENDFLSNTVATNDNDADGDSLTFSLDTNVSNGSLTFNSNGSFVYVPTANFNGTDSFTYIITDPEGATDTATVNITIDSTNVAPDAVDDSYSVDENDNLSHTVATNDSDSDGDSLTFSLDTDVSNGSLTFNSNGSFVYVPTADFNGDDSFTYIITDPEGATDTATVSITIDSTNVAPDAVDDDFSVSENGNLSTTVATNDSDADGDSLTFSLDTNVSNGSLTFNSDGSFVYVPTTNFNGADSFTYIITDPEGATDTATVNITIDSTNVAPDAVDDDFSVDENDFLSNTVATNDNDADGDSLTFTLDTNVSNGTLIFDSDGSFVYIPTENFNGTDSFTYIITDLEGATDTATVNITIDSTNVAPIAVDDDFSVDENDDLSDTVATNDSDADGDSLTFTLDTDVSNGTLIFDSDGSFVYVPTADFNGTDSFTYIITDREGASDTATVNITIDSTNVAPIAVDDDFSVDENDDLSDTVATNDSDADGDSLTFTLDTDVNNGSLTFNNDGSFVYVPTANFNGTDSFTYIITDPEGASDTATVNITIDSTNVAPIAVDDDFSVDENNDLSDTVATNDSDADGDSLTFSLDTDVSNGSLTFNSDGSFDYTPTASYFGTDSFTYIITDPEGATDTATVNITIDSTNVAPIAVDDDFSVDENDDLSDTVATNDSDADGDSLTFSLDTDVSNGSLTFNSDGSFVYVPTADFNGTDSFTYIITDREGATDTATVNVTIDSTNVAPIAVDDDFSVDENDDLSNTVATNDSDADGDSLTFSLDTDVSNGSLTFNSDGSFDYTPTASYFGTDSFTYIITDPEGATDTATVNITIDSTNVAPIAVDDDFSVDENDDLSDTVATNDSDADGDSLTFTLDTDVSNGSLTFNSDGSFVYVPTANFNGADSFTYTLTDPEGASDTATVNITIDSTNVAPDAVDDDFSVDENDFLSDTVATNDSDADGDSLTFTLDTNVSNGTLIFDSDGSFVYIPTDNFNGTDSFTYIITDPEGASDTATVNITIDSTNVAPIAVDDDFSVDENDDLSDTVATNDSDADGDSLTFSLDTDVSNGSLTFNSDGSFVYIPTDNFNGTDSFTYIITDPEGASDTATVNITIDSTNVAPIAVDDDFSVDENDDLSDTVATNDSDADGDSLTFTLDTDVNNGSLTFNSDGSFDYTPTENYFGTDSFTYIITDPEGASDTATVNITIDSTNVAPIAVDDDFSVDENDDLSDTVATNDNDADGDGLTFTLDTDVSNGSLTFNSDGSFDYTPTENYFGTDSFTYIITDPEGASDTATVNITIDSTNVAPIAVDDDFSVDENDDLSDTVATNDNDADGDGLTFTLDTDVSNGSLTFNSDGSFDYTPTENYFGTDSFTYIITDPEGASDTATVNITIDSTNVAPIAVDDDFSVDENDDLSDTVATNDSDADGDSLTFSLDTDVSNGSLTFNSDGSFDYTPTENYFGTDSFTYIITDPEGASDTATVNITIDSTNVAPIAVDDDFSVDENDDLSDTVATNDSDADGDSLTFSLDTDVSNGSLTFNSDGSFDYTPTENYFGTDSFTYIITDPEGASDTATVNITIDSTNVPPDAVDDDFSVDENDFLSVTVATNDSDADGDSLTFSVNTDVSNGTLIFDSDGSFVYVPTDNFNGTDSFTYIITDPEGATDTATVNITIKSTNVPPIALDDDFSVDENDTLSDTVATNDRDADGDSLTFSLDTDVSNGSLTLNSDGGFDYTPTANFFGTDSFTYSITDPEGESDTAKVYITIDSTNVPPIAVDDDFSVDENDTLSDTVANNDSDADGDSLTFSLDTDVSNGSLTFNSDGSFEYTSTANYFGTDSFTYIITDPEGKTDTAVANITIDSTNVPPDAVDDDFSVDENDTLSDTVATNDSDADGDNLTFSLSSDVSNGTLTFNSNGSFEYTPDANFFGADNFTYTITDPEGETDTATAKITIDSTNAPPDAVDDDFNVDENDSISDTVKTNDSDADGDSLTFSLDSDVNNGILSFNSDGSFEYTPEANFYGTDSFTYTITDPEGASDTATANITIDSTNAAPESNNENPVFNIERNITLTNTVAQFASDPDGDDLTFSVISTVKNGSLTFKPDGSFVYVPQNGFSGFDRFTYLVDDGHGGTTQANINIFVRVDSDENESRREYNRNSRDTNGIYFFDTPYLAQKINYDSFLQSLYIKPAVKDQHYYIDKQYGGGVDQEIIRYEADNSSQHIINTADLTFISDLVNEPSVDVAFEIPIDESLGKIEEEFENMFVELEKFINFEEQANGADTFDQEFVQLFNSLF